MISKWKVVTNQLLDAGSFITSICNQRRTNFRPTGGCMIEWTNTGPCSYFMESIPLEFSPHVLKFVIQLCAVFHPFAFEFETYARSSLWAVRCGSIVRPWGLGFRGHALVPITCGCPSFRGAWWTFPHCCPSAAWASLFLSHSPSCRVRLVALRKEPGIRLHTCRFDCLATDWRDCRAT